jgi:hypothetical protein
MPIRAGKLKNWETDIKTCDMARQEFRNSGIQNFRFSPLHLLPENLAGGFRVGVGTGNILNMLKHGSLRAAIINNYLMFGMDPILTVLGLPGDFRNVLESVIALSGHG